LYWYFPGIQPGFNGVQSRRMNFPRRMNFRRSAWKMFAMVSVSAASLYGGAIDVSTASTALLGTGETLSFEIPIGNYARNAASMGLPLYPTDVSFMFVSATNNSVTQFDASLQSADGSVCQLFAGPLTFGAGAYSSSNYSGAVSILEGSLHLSPGISPQIFSGLQGVLTLRNTGSAITLGLAPNTLQQDLLVSLSGGPSGQLTVGALHGAVALQEPVQPPQAPEPHSMALVTGGGALLLFLGQCKRRVAAQTKT
jgi:hypothetical protein